LAPLYYRGAAAAIVAYDITNPESFKKAQYWVKVNCANSLLFCFLLVDFLSFPLVLDFAYAQNSTVIEFCNSIFYSKAADILKTCWDYRVLFE
jgi:hypothetical protein